MFRSAAHKNHVFRRRLTPPDFTGARLRPSEGVVDGPEKEPTRSTLHAWALLPSA
jgi:hypothetical protein